MAFDDKDSGEEPLGSPTKDGHREVPPPPGLPAGWKAIEKRFISGPQAGQVYMRFYGGPDGKHKGVVSLAAAIRKDAEDRGCDPDKAIEQFKKDRKENRKEAAALAKARDEAVKVNGARRDELVAFFRETHGPLDGPTVSAMPGWRVSFEYTESSKQTHALYTDPDGLLWRVLKDIECSFAVRIKHGEDFTALLASARAAADQKAFARAAERARQTAFAQENVAIRQVFLTGGSPNGIQGTLELKTALKRKSACAAGEPPVHEADVAIVSATGKELSPRTPPQRATDANMKDVDVSASKTIATGAPASRKKVAGPRCRDACGGASPAPPRPAGDAPTATAGGGAGVAPARQHACPDCNHALGWSDFSGGAYKASGGWECDETGCSRNFRNAGAFRWLCRLCERDFCDHCSDRLPPPVQTSGRGRASKLRKLGDQAEGKKEAAPADGNKEAAPPTATRGPKEGARPAGGPPSPAVKASQPAAAKVDGPVRYLVDNSKLQATTKGLGYRLTKEMANKAVKDPCANWGSFVMGVDQGDGWLSVSGRFLPIIVNNIIVLKKSEEVNVSKMLRTRICQKTPDVAIKQAISPKAATPPEKSATQQRPAVAKDAVAKDAVAKDPTPTKKKAGSATQGEARAPNRYIVFFMKERAAIIKEGVLQNPNDIIREVADRWRKLSKDEKSKWGEEALAMAPKTKQGADAQPAAAKLHCGFRFAKMARAGSAIAGRKRGRPPTKNPSGGAEDSPPAAPAATVAAAGEKRPPAAEAPAGEKRPAAAMPAPPSTDGGATAEPTAGPPTKRKKLKLVSASPPASASPAAPSPPPTAAAAAPPEGPETAPASTAPSPGAAANASAGVPAAAQTQAAAADSTQDAVQQLRSDASKKAAATKRNCGPKERLEVFRNLHGEVVVVNASACAQRSAPKALSDLQQSDIDSLTGDDIWIYEKELKLTSKRSLAERIARLEQMAQRTTLPQWAAQATASGGATGSSATAAAEGSPSKGIARAATEADPFAEIQRLATQIDDGEARGNDFDARFLQAFLALPPDDRQHASASEITRLERCALIVDGGAYSINERRTRLKEKLWEQRSSDATATPKHSAQFFKSWLSSSKAASAAAASTSASAAASPEVPAPTSAAGSPEVNATPVAGPEVQREGTAAETVPVAGEAAAARPEAEASPAAETAPIAQEEAAARPEAEASPAAETAPIAEEEAAARPEAEASPVAEDATVFVNAAPVAGPDVETEDTAAKIAPAAEEAAAAQPEAEPSPAAEDATVLATKEGESGEGGAKHC